MATTRSRNPRAIGKPKVLVLATGGTIQGGASTRHGEGLADYRIGDIPASALLEAVPELHQVAHVRVETVANIDSCNISLALLSELAARIVRAFSGKNPPAGVVVTHGTDTLEETAYFLSLVLVARGPIVVTGAMRPGTALSADGPLNLLNAVRVAVAPESKGQGVLVLMNDTIHAARDVIKTSARGVSTFCSPDTGPLGVADPDQVRYYRRTVQRAVFERAFAPADLRQLPAVEWIACYQGAGRTAFDACVAAGVAGIVITDPVTEELKTAARDAIKQGVAVVLTNRGFGGRVRLEDEYRTMGIIQADNLTPRKARILLRLALARRYAATELQRLFEQI